ncbi:hypothetical protein FLGE108171_09690 [Flavobacterium gelidilacus]|jgi:hypothetical protein|uniref:hypothetical protein n=1 Tax=Flavobacterium gelidilacus TaxID=206041 RepID=UPI000426F4C0|nr:hypothetical protein [Flavobacterium gelidilacus]
MKKLFKLIVIFSFLVVVHGCNEESYIENIGFVEESNNQMPGNGSVVFWTSNANPIFFCNGGLNFYVDGSYVGTLSETRNVVPNCGTSSASSFSISLNEGVHSVTANGTGEFCTFSYNFNIDIIRNTCLKQELN